MSVKSQLVTDLKDDGLTTGHAARNYTFGTMPDTGDYDQNVLVIAECMKEMVAFLKAIYDGVPVIDYSLRGGQRSSALQAMVLASFEKREPES